MLVILSPKDVAAGRPESSQSFSTSSLFSKREIHTNAPISGVILTRDTASSRVGDIVLQRASDEDESLRIFDVVNDQVMHKLNEKLRFGRLCLPNDTWQIIEAESWKTRMTDRDTDNIGTEFATMMVAELDKRRSKKFLVVYHGTNRRQLRTSDCFLKIVGIVGFGKRDSAWVGNLGPSREASLRASPILAIVYEATTKSYSSIPPSTWVFGGLELDVQRATGAGVRGPRRLDTRDGLDDGRLSG